MTTARGAAVSEYAERTVARLSDRLSVEITAGLGGATCEWDPGMPERLTAEELRAYRKARNALLQRLAERIGGRILVVET